MESHELANIFPMMNEVDFANLKKDISENGFDEERPILLFEGKILDGRNRHRACEELGITPIFRQYEGENPLYYVISNNLNRRHLNESQRGLIASRLMNVKWGGDRMTKTPIGVLVTKEKASELMKIGTSTIDRVREIEEKHPEWITLIESGEKTAGNLYGELKKEESETPDWLRYLDVWNFKENTGEGISNMPPEIVKNLLYYYTEEGDLIYDCFAGSGQTLEIAKELNRKCICSDISPTNNSIIKWNVDDDFSNFPKDLSKVKLIFLDPPYWNMVDYGDGWSNLSIIDFYKKFDGFVKNLKGIGRKDVKIALLIMPLKKEDYYDLGFECSKIFQNNGFKIEQRLCVPLLRNWSIDARLKTSKENKEILTSSLRDLIVYGINYDTNTPESQRETKQI